MMVKSLVLNGFTHDARVLKTAHYLGEQGHQIEVIAMHDAPLPIHDCIGDVEVWRIKLISRGLPKLAPLQAIKYAEWIVRACLRGRKADVLHCNDMNTLPVGVLLKILTLGRVKVVYDAHEYESNRLPNQSQLSVRLYQAFEGVLIRFANCVITVSDGIAKSYENLYGIRRPALVLNCPRYCNVKKKNIFRENIGISAESTIYLYQGAFGRGRGVETLLDTFATLESSKVIVFMGYGALEGKIREYAARHPNIFFYPAVAPEVLLDYTSSADFGISTIEDVSLSYALCLPNKLFEFLMAGLPVIVSNLPEMKRLVEENGVGVVAQENTVEGLRQAIQCVGKLDSNMLQEKIALCKLRYNWEEQEKNLKAVYDEL